MWWKRGAQSQKSTHLPKLAPLVIAIQPSKYHALAMPISSPASKARRIRKKLCLVHRNHVRAAEFLAAFQFLQRCNRHTPLWWWYYDLMESTTLPLHTRRCPVWLTTSALL